MARQHESQSRRKSAIIATLVAAVMLLGGCGQSSSDQISVQAAIDGVAIESSEPNDPIALSDEVALDLTIENISSEAVVVRHIRFAGEVLDLTFLTYDTAVRVELAPGDRRTLPPILVDFYDVGGQASGYLRGQVQLFDDQRNLVGSEQVFLEATGSGFSTLEWFNLLLLGGLTVAVAWNFMRLIQRRLPANRLVRALRFLSIGALGGLTLAVAFSTLRIWPLDSLAWVLMAAVGGIIGYIVGFVLPGADDDLHDLLDEQDVLDAVIDEQTEIVLTAGAGPRAQVPTASSAESNHHLRLNIGSVPAASCRLDGIVRRGNRD